MGDTQGTGHRTSSVPALAVPEVEARAAFDAHTQAWEAYTTAPLGRLRQELTQRHLASYVEGLAPDELCECDRQIASATSRMCLLDAFVEQIRLGSRCYAQIFIKCKTTVLILDQSGSIFPLPGQT